MKAEISSPDRPPVKAEITVANTDELLITVTGDSPLSPAEIADAFLAMISEPPEPDGPRTVRVVTIRLVRYAVEETTLALDTGRSVWI